MTTPTAVASEVNDSSSNPPAHVSLPPSSSSSSTFDFDTSISICLNVSSTPSEVNSSLISILRHIESGSTLLTNFSTNQFQQMLTMVLQSQIGTMTTTTTTTGVPSSSQPIAHQYRILIERMRMRLIGLPSSCNNFRHAMENVIRIHTPTEEAVKARSRRNSLSGRQSGRNSPTNTATAAAAAAAHSRRNSLVPVVDDETIASMRLHAFRFIFEWLRYVCRSLSNVSNSPVSPPLSDSDELSDFLDFNLRLHLLSLSDVWSAIRKVGSNDLSKRGGLFEIMSTLQAEKGIQAIRGLFETSSTTTPAPTPIRTPTWQQEEGGLAGLTATFHALCKNGGPVPAIVQSLSPLSLLKFLSHTQLTVREFTITAIVGWIELLRIKGTDSKNIKGQLIDTLMIALENGLNRDTTHFSLSDYEAEGILNLLHALGLTLDLFTSLAIDFFPIFDCYLAHPASSVRQAVGEILSTLGRQHSESNQFDLLQRLSCVNGEEEQAIWTKQEIQARQEANTNIMTDVHTHAVYFTIPPPINMALPTIHKRTTVAAAVDGSGALATTGDPSTMLPLSSSSSSSSASASSSVPSHRLSWQWKEGALMSLELFLRSNPPPSKLQSLARHFTLIFLSNQSWCWELRRMAYQCMEVFVVTSLEERSNGLQLLHNIKQWIHQAATSSSSSSIHEGNLHVRPHVTSAVGGVTALSILLTYLHQSSSSSSTTKKKDTNDNVDDLTIERKWNRDVTHSHKIDTIVLETLLQMLPELLNQIEHLINAANAFMIHGIESNVVESTSQTPLSSTPSTTSFSSSSSSGQSDSSLVSWEQFVTLGVQVIISAYATVGPRAQTNIDAMVTAPTPSVPTSFTMHLSHSSILQHVQCVLDHFRMVRAVTSGIDRLTSIQSAPAQLIHTRTSVSAGDASQASNRMHLPIEHSRIDTHVDAHAATSLTMLPTKSHHHQGALMMRARGKRLESWLLNHVAPFFSSFSRHIPHEAQSDMLDLLLKLFSDYHMTLSNEVRLSFIDSMIETWSSMSRLNYVTQSLQTLFETYLVMIDHSIKVDHVNERKIFVELLKTMIKHDTIDTKKLRRIFEIITGWIKEEYLSLSLDSPPPPSPVHVLSPASAAHAAEVEAWDDWDEEEDDNDGGATNTKSNTTGGGNELSPSEWFHQALEFVKDVGPILMCLHGQSYSNVETPMTMTTPIYRSRSSSLAHVSPSSTPAYSSSSSVPFVHGQSSLADLITAYEHATQTGGGGVDSSARQIELLDWIQQWTQQVKQRITSNAGDGNVDTDGTIRTATTLPSHLYTIHHPMPVNTLFDETYAAMPEEFLKKLNWLKIQATKVTS